MTGLARAVSWFALVATIGCAPARSPSPTPAARAGAMLPDVRQAKDRPPVALVAREGDPASAIAVAVTTDQEDADPEAPTALAGIVEGRLGARGLRAQVTPAWDGFRASVLVANAAAARTATDAIRDALSAPVKDDDVAAAKKKLTALRARPLRDAALAKWARCTGALYAMPARASKIGEDVTTARLEAWRAAMHGLGRVAIAATGPAAIGEAVVRAIAEGPAWRPAADKPSARAPGAGVEVDLYESPAESLLTAATLHLTLDVGSASAAVATAEALGDPHGPLATRLAGLELPFRLREVTGAAHPRGGCVGVVLDTTRGEGDRSATDLAPLIADAVALVHVEAQVLGEGGALPDGRTLARRSGDARESAERAAWWTLASASNLASASASSTASGGTTAPAPSMHGSVALGLPSRRGGGPIALPRDVVSVAVDRAIASWQKPVVEGRSRVEPGQGEVYVLFASPCGTDGESDKDAGLTALVTTAAAETARAESDVRVETWIAPDAAGLLAHGPALPGESPAAHARRIADVAARALAADPVALGTLGKARADLVRLANERDGSALGALGLALAPANPSAVVPFGREESLARSADAAVLTRAQALRAGPFRLAVLANVDAAQAEAAVRAADRWVDRRPRAAKERDGERAASPPGDEPRVCRASPQALAKPGTYATEPRAGAWPEAYLAFPLPAGDAAARAAAIVIAAALEGDGDRGTGTGTGGMLDRALGGGLARSASATVLGWPRAPALVVRVVSAEASLDQAVMQARALVDRLHAGGLPQADFERAIAGASHTRMATLLDPRARVAATWRGEPIGAATPAPMPTPEDVRAFAAKQLGEDAMVVVASRPARAAGGRSP